MSGAGRTAARSAPFIRIASFAFLAAFAGCGLDSFPYLYPPGAVDGNGISAPVAEASAFSNNPANDTGDFINLGFAVYYRIYFDLTKAQADKATIQQLNDDYPTQVESKLRTSLNYLPFYALDDTLANTPGILPPSIAMTDAEKGTPIQFNIVRPGYAGSSIPVTEVGVFKSTDLTTLNQHLRRYSSPTYAPSDPSFFNLSIAPGAADKDVDASGFTPSTNTAYLQIVVLSYGVNASDFTSAYSTALVLRDSVDPFTLDGVTVNQ
jgi:hypothetical protein